MTKYCEKKFNQKVFLLNLNRTASCCRADPIPLTKQSIDNYLDLWAHESQQLAQGVELPGCKHCWSAENKGQISYRQQPFMVDSNVVEIHIDNACNQMCSYCSPKFSSTWENNVKQFGNFVDISKSAKENLKVSEVNNQDNIEFWINELKDFLSRGPVGLRLLGGEPLMQRQNLQRLLELNTDTISVLKINTNLNPPSNKFLKWMLDAFPKDKLVFEISLDTVPEYNAIPRAGFDVKKFEENLDLLVRHNISFTFMSVVSVLSIFSFNKFQNWLDKNNYQSKFSQLNNPDCLSPEYLPEQFKNSILTHQLPDSISRMLSYTSKSVDLKLFEQYNYLTQYFERTQTNINDPMLATYWHWLQETYK